MKVAISAEGSSLESRVDTRFGRTKCFIIFDMETGAHEAVDNEQALNVPQGAGIQAAETVARLGATSVISGHCGPKAFRTLQAAGISIYLTDEGTVAETVEKFKSGKLECVAKPDVEGHWV